MQKDSLRYDQSAAYAAQRGKQDGAEDQSELTLWFMKAELLMLTGFFEDYSCGKHTCQERDRDKVELQHRVQLPLRLRGYIVNQVL